MSSAANADGDATETEKEDRRFLRDVNALASSMCSAAFGDTGMPNPSKARKVLLFVDKAKNKWPEFGTDALSGARGFDEIDPECPFWKNGRERFLRALRVCFAGVNSRSVEDVMRRSLLADLGFIVIHDFIAAEEEAELLEYWRPNGSVFRQGQNEQHTNRRFFHYGPILPRQSFGTTRSTLNVIPGRMGAMPPVIESQALRQRIRTAAAGMGDEGLRLDQLYVNYYSAMAKGRIGFHHDHPGTMGPVVAGLSLGSDCEFQLLALDPELAGSGPTLYLQLPSRSLYLMTGLSRYHLQHGIPVHGKDRFSLTFRTVDQSGAGSKSQWRRGWHDIPPAEAAKCHWPLLPPVSEL